MISAWWLFLIVWIVVFVVLFAWFKISLIKLDRDYWYNMFLIEKTHGRNLEHIYAGEPTEEYPDWREP